MHRLPKTFFIKSTEAKDNPDLWRSFIKWLNSKHDEGWSGNFQSYYGLRDGYTANTTESVIIENKDLVISICDWAYLVQFEEEKNLTPHYLSKKDLLIARSSFNCQEWKSAIESLLREYLYDIDSTMIRIPDEVIKRANKECTSLQKEHLRSKGLVLEEDKSVELPCVTGETTAYLLLATGRKKYLLNNNYNWVLENVDGKVYLTPTKNNL